MRTDNYQTKFKLSNSLSLLCVVGILFQQNALAQAQSTTVIVVTNSPTVTVSQSGVTRSILASPTYPGPSADYTPESQLKVSILNTTNYYRYQHNASFLWWNDSLASYASDYADYCVWEHSQGAPGENLAQGYGNVTAAVQAWGDERRDYSFAGSQTGFEEATGHFTQLVWKSTQTVGCAAIDCHDKNSISGWFLVCEYWPAGNVVFAGPDENMLFVQNVQGQVNDGEGFDPSKALQGTAGVGTRLASSTTPSATATTEGNAASGGKGLESNEDGLVSRHKGQLGLVMFLVFACAFM